MTSEDSLFSALTNAGAVSALVGTRVYPDQIPPGTGLPCIGFARSNTEYDNTIHGTTLGARITFEIFCLAQSREAADALADAVVGGIDDSGFVPESRRVETEGEESDSFDVTVLTVNFWE